MAALAPDETAQQLLRRAAARGLRTGVPCIDAAAPAGGSLLELYGASGSGKTLLLLSAAAATAARGDRVLLFALDGGFDAERLQRLVAARTPSAAAAEEALARVAVYRCDGVFEWLATLVALRTAPPPADGAAHPALVLVDHCAAFLDEARLLEAVAGPGPSLLPTAAAELGHLLDAFGAVGIAAKPALFGAGGPEAHAEYMPKAWQALVAARVVLGVRSEPGQLRATVTAGGVSQRFAFGGADPFS